MVRSGLMTKPNCIFLLSMVFKEMFIDGESSKRLVKLILDYFTLHPSFKLTLRRLIFSY